MIAELKLWQQIQSTYWRLPNKASAGTFWGKRFNDDLHGSADESRIWCVWGIFSVSSSAVCHRYEHFWLKGGRRLDFDDMALRSSTDHACYPLYCASAPMWSWLNWSCPWVLMQEVYDCSWADCEREPFSDSHLKPRRLPETRLLLFIRQRGINSDDASQMHALDTDSGEADMLSAAKAVEAHVWCQSDFIRIRI